MTRARELGKLANKNSLTADNTNNFVGIGSTQPDSRLDVLGGAQISGITTFSSRVDVGAAITIGAASGIVSATAFYGDGSNLEGVASAGLGTALAETQPGNVIYYTDNILGIGSTMVVTVPAGSDVAYTQYAEISLDENIDLIVSEGDDLVTDILGLSTSGIATLTGIGGRIRAGTFTNKAGTGAPQLTFGAEIPVGYGLTGAGGINVSGAATIGGNLTVGGVLTYDDVTNVDSLGIVTARGGFEIGASGVGGTITAAGAAEFAGIVTARSGLRVVGGGINVIGGGATITGVTTFFNDIRVKGVIENVSAATTFLDANSKVVLELDLLGSTTYSYAMQPASIGIVSFKNMPADAQGGATVTVLFTQASDTTGGVGNTTHDVGLGTDCTVIPFVGGAAQTGISTRAFVGGGTTFVGLSTTPGDKEFVSFFVHYNGGTNTDANSYDIFVTKNGQFRPSAVGV
jgi:hypothetical protein